jgi:FdhD protein
MTSSGCGICAKSSIDAVASQFPPLPQDDLVLSPEKILAMPGQLAAVQETFRRTGGLHGCALFEIDDEGHARLLVMREDVGRHNAVDKLLGWALLEDRLPLSRCVLFLSGRISFELVHKALAGGIPVIAAISAPSSLAVEFAGASGQTLIGFVRGETMNIYAGDERIKR